MKRLLLILAALPTFGAPVAVAWTTPTAPYWTGVNPTIGASFDSSGTHTNTLYGTGSTGTGLTYLWTNISGPNTPTITSPTSATTTVTGIIASTPAANYVFRLTVTDSMMATNSIDLQVGAVPRDTNDNVVLDAHGIEAFGALKAFGYNPWWYEDSQHYSAVHQQASWWPTNYSIDWATLNTSGTISWPFYAIGFNPGAACTTLSAAITSATQTSISISDARCLAMTNLPDWILVGSFGYGSGSLEMMRVIACTSVATGMACTGSTVAATLTVDYDGRGMTGNTLAIGGYVTTVPAQAWSNGSAVGEMRIQGSGTLFSTDATQAICPAGVPGPPGVVNYSTGTVTLTASSTTVVGSGTTWNTGNGVKVGGFIRVTATHNSGTSFIFWRQIVTVTDTTHLVLDHAAPTGIDGSSFSYKITDPAMYLALQFNGNNSDVPQLLQNGVGCESETAMFALPVHDIPAFDSVYQTGSLKYSYKTSIGQLIVPNTTNSWAFYGVGHAARSLWYQSGLTETLTLANYIDEHVPRDPEIADGYVPNQPLTYGGAAISAMQDKLLNGSTALTWTNLEQFARVGISVLVPGGTPSACNATDTREGSYYKAHVTLISNNDPDAAAQGINTGLANILLRDQGTMSFPGCLRNASDGYVGAEVNSFSNSSVFNPAGPSGTQTIQPLTLTNGSTAVTGSGFTNGMAGTYPTYIGSVPGYCWGVDIATITVTNGSSAFTVASGTVTQQTMIYFYDGSMVGAFEYNVTGASGSFAGVWRGSSGTFSAMTAGGGPIVGGGQSVGGYNGILAQTSPTTPPVDNLANNQALEHIWPCKFNSSSSLTLFRPWDGVSSSALTGGNQYYMSYYNIGTFGQQWFFYGIGTDQWNWARWNPSSTIKTGALAILPLMGNAFAANGWYANSANHGTSYQGIFDACGSPANDVPAGSFDSIHGFEGCGAGGLTSNATQEARFFSIEAGSPMLHYYLANPNSTTKAVVDTFYGAIFGLTSTCAASVLSTCDGTTAYNLLDSSFTQPRYPGYVFGMGGYFVNTWPAVRDMSTAQLCTAYPGSGACNSQGGSRLSGNVRTGTNTRQ